MARSWGGSREALLQVPATANQPTGGALRACLEDTRQLYNAALEEWREAWRMGRQRVTFNSQDAQLKEIRADDPERYGRWSFKCERAAIRRLDRAFQGYFKRIKAGA
jgi:putative transposase